MHLPKFTSNILCWLAFLVFAASGTIANLTAQTKSAAGFTHPGILHSTADLDRMHDMVQAGIQPWARGFEALQSVPQSSLAYVIQGPFKVVAYENGQYEYRRDASAAYNLAIMWICTGDARFAEKSLGIIRAWAAEMESFDKGDHITGGMGVSKFAAAAEILRYRKNSGWTENDTSQFVKFLEKMKPALDKPDLFMNQGGYALLGMTAIAVFTDDLAFYQKTINRATVGDGKDPQKDPAISKTIWASGQVVEMGRDQTHPQGGLGTLASIAQTAYIQGKAITGVDLFEYLDRRLLLGYEYLAAHNLGFAKKYEPLQEDGKKGYYARFSPIDRGKLTPIFELIYQQYKYRGNASAESLNYVTQVREYLMPEGFSEDFAGFGTLLFSLPESKEDSEPLGPPKLRETANDTQDAGRILAANFNATQGVGREYFTDVAGRTELVASNIQANDTVRYDNVDFGLEPVDTFIARAGSASPAGCKIDLRIDDPVLEPIAVLQVVNTGWWSTFETFSSQLNRPLTGKHTVYLKFYGGNHVYKFQCNLHWFKFGNADSVATELKSEKEQSRFPKIAGNKFGAVLSGSAMKGRTLDGSPVVMMTQLPTQLSYPSVEFSSGAKTISIEIADGQGTVEARSGDAQGEVFAEFSIPPSDNVGHFRKKITAPILEGAKKLTGHQMVFLTFKGEPLKLKSFQLDALPDEP